MKSRPIHPFPARMAPELALNAMSRLQEGSTVLDPMSGSGTVLRQAVDLGHNAIGFDVDPLAILMARVWTTPIDGDALRHELESVIDESSVVDLRSQRLPWVDAETSEFMNFWFGDKQRRDLKRIAYVLALRRQARLGSRRRAAVDALMLALSRIIITKDQGASLARDTSHSRPHKVADTSSYDVLAGFEKSAKFLANRLESTLPGRANVDFGDARKVALGDNSVDSVLTSPPYLNAIDYMRGHRLALVWLGYKLEELRLIRSGSIGTERACNGTDEERKVICASMLHGAEVADRLRLMIQRYAGDLIAMMSEIARVLRSGGHATVVVGNSCLKGAFVRNADGVRDAGLLANLRLVDATERDLPANNRYLPVTASGSLSKRMRTETVLTFCKP